VGKSHSKIIGYRHYASQGNGIAKNIGRNSPVKILSGEPGISRLSLVCIRLIMVQDGDKLDVSIPMNLK
jgi:hypothetical protein